MNFGADKPQIARIFKSLSLNFIQGGIEELPDRRIKFLIAESFSNTRFFKTTP